MGEVREPGSEEMAWAAGFVDAEGCFSYSLSARVAAVRVAQTSREPLDRLASALGTGKVRGPFSVQRPYRPSIKEQYAYYAYGSRAVQVSEVVWPFLSEPKRRQAARMRRLVTELNPLVAKNLQPLRDRPHGLTRREEFGWTAGFFDGDGCFSYSNSTGGMCVAIGQRDREVLDRFRRIVGVGKIYGPYDRKPGGLGGITLFQYRAAGFEKTQAIAGMLWFKLGSAKREQATQVMASRLRKCQRGHVLGAKHNGCPRCVAEAWARKRVS
jgi:hypothetical protein